MSGKSRAMILLDGLLVSSSLAPPVLVVGNLVSAQLGENKRSLTAGSCLNGLLLLVLR